MIQKLFGAQPMLKEFWKHVCFWDDWVFVGFVGFVCVVVVFLEVCVCVCVVVHVCCLFFLVCRCSVSMMSLRCS